MAYTSAAGLLTASSDGTLRSRCDAGAGAAGGGHPPSTRTAPLAGRRPDGSVATIAGQRSTWSADGTRFQLQGHGDDVTSVAFSRDGRSIVTASVDHIARIWDARSGRLVEPLRGHFGSVSDRASAPTATGL